MPKVEVETILDATFRANPGYGLISLEQLSADEQRALTRHQHDADLYGVLYPRERAGLGVKSVCHRAASLYLALKEPARIPARFRAMLGDDCNDVIAELVLDGILEMDFKGRFVSGPEAHQVICKDRPPSEPGATASQQSLEALKYGQALGLTDSKRLSARLYFYGRQPVSPMWKQRLPSSVAVANYLRVGERGTLANFLARGWIAASPSGASDAWLTWRSRHHQAPSAPSAQLTYKLYVSPATDLARDAFEATARVLSTSRAWAFKVGGDVYGLLRPDKIVAYFSSFEDLESAADELSRKLHGFPAHGVPFTADIGGGGLLSWGVDPPLDPQLVEWHGPESWRLWVTNRLAIALVGVMSTPSSMVEPWEFALDRVRLDGVDTTLWMPDVARWSRDPTYCSEAR